MVLFRQAAGGVVFWTVVVMPVLAVPQLEFVL